VGRNSNDIHGVRRHVEAAETRGFRKESLKRRGSGTRLIQRRRTVRGRVHCFYPLLHPRISHRKHWQRGRNKRRDAVRQRGNHGIDGPYVSVVVIVIIEPGAVNRVLCRVGVRGEEVGVDLTGRRMIRVIRIDVNVLEGRENKCQQECQDRLDCRRAPHQYESTRATPFPPTAATGR